MTPVLYRLGRVCVRHRWFVLAVWLVVFAALAFGARSVGPERQRQPHAARHRQPEGHRPPRRRSFPARRTGPTRSCSRAPKGAKITDAKYADGDRRHRLGAAQGPRRPRGDEPAVDGGRGAGVQGRDRSATSRSTCKPSPSDLTTDDAQRIVALGRSGRGRGPARSAFGGYIGQKVSKPETHDSEVIGLGMAVIVLLFTFGTVVAMGLPIITAIIGLVVRAVDHHADQPRRRSSRPSRRRWRR